MIVEDAQRPSVYLSYSEPSPVAAGPVIITATFSEPLSTTPLITIGQPGSVDVGPVYMTGSQTTWSYTYQVHCADGSDFIDGTAAVSINGGFDYAGNEVSIPRRAVQAVS